MKKIHKVENTFVSNRTPGIAGIFCVILGNILGPVIIVATICFVVNFACQFVGIDFNMFHWVEEQVYAFPALWEEWSASFGELFEELMAKISS